MEVTKQGLDVFKCEGTLKGSEIKPSPKTLTVGKQAKPLKAEAQLKACANPPDVALQTLDIFAGMLLSNTFFSSCARTGTNYDMCVQAVVDFLKECTRPVLPTRSGPLSTGSQQQMHSS